MAKIKPQRTDKIKYLPEIIRLIKSFTFIELIISSAIFFVIIFAVFLSFRTGTFGYENIDATISVYQNAQTAFSRINLDLGNSFAYSADETKFTGAKDSISFLALADKSYASGPTRDYAFILYKFENDKLLRICRRNKDALNDEADIKPQKAAAGVKEITFSYAYTDSTDKPMEWSDTWDDPEKLPSAVKIKLALSNKKVEQVFQRVVYLPR